METTNLSRVVDTVFPTLSGSSLTYNAQKNIFITNGFTSAAGNTYYQGIRVSDRIAIKYNIGQGYYHTFLNGIEVFGYDGTKTKLIGSRSYCCNYFNESDAKREAVGIVLDYIKGQAKLLEAQVEINKLEEFSKQIVNGAYSQVRCLA